MAESDNNHLDQDDEKTQIFQEAPSGGRPDAKEYPQLYCRRGTGLEGRTLPLLAPLLFGRSPDCDVTLEDTNISRKHANFNVEEGRVTVKDLGSANHVYVNDSRIDELELSDGDTVNIGKTYEFIFIAPLGAEKRDDSATRVVSWDDEEDEDKTRVLSAGQPPRKEVEKKKPNLLRIALIGAILILLLYAGGLFLNQGQEETSESSEETTEQALQEPGKPPQAEAVVEEDGAIVSDAENVAVSPEIDGDKEEPRDVAVAGPTATPVPSSTPTRTPTAIPPTPTPTTRITAGMVKESVLAAWLSAVASGQGDSLAAVYANGKAPSYWLPALGLPLSLKDAEVSSGDKDREFVVSTELHPDSGQPIAVSLRWKLKSVDGNILIREEIPTKTSLEELVLAPCRQALRAGDMDRTVKALGVVKGLLEDEGRSERLKWEPEVLTGWEQDLINCRELMEQADRALAQGDLELAGAKTRTLSRAAGELDSPIVRRGETNWFLLRAREIREEIRARQIEAIPTPDPAIARKAAGLIEKAGLAKELGNLDESRRLYREARDILPEDHSLLGRIPPWALRE